jgi:hypothetical protein
LTYYLWGPGYSWDVMLIVTTRTNQLGVFFDECTQKAATGKDYEAPRGRLYIFECKNPKIPA